MTPPAPQAAAPARLPASQNTKAARLLAAAAQLLASLERGVPLDAHLLREAMTAAFEAERPARRLALERRLRSLRGRRRSVPAQIRPRHPEKGRRFRPRARDDREACGAVALAYAPLRGKRPVPAIFDAARPRIPDDACGSTDAGRARARTLGRHRPSRHPCRDRRRRACPERACRNASWAAVGPVPASAGHALQRRADRRLSRRRDSAHDRADEPALFGLARHRAHHARRDRAAYPFRACAVCRTADGLWS